MISLGKFRTMPSTSAVLKSTCCVGLHKKSLKYVTGYAILMQCFPIAHNSPLFMATGYSIPRSVAVNGDLERNSMILLSATIFCPNPLPTPQTQKSSLVLLRGRSYINFY